MGRNELTFVAPITKDKDKEELKMDSCGCRELECCENCQPGSILKANPKTAPECLNCVKLNAQIESMITERDELQRNYKATIDLISFINNGINKLLKESEKDEIQVWAGEPIKQCKDILMKETLKIDPSLLLITMKLKYLLRNTK